MASQIERIRRTVGEEFHFRAGNPRAMLMVHGIIGGPFQLRELGERIHRAFSYDTHGFLLPAHCEDYEALTQVNYPRWTRQVERDYLELRGRYEQVDLCGFSLGGVLCLNLVRKHAVRNLISLAAPMWFTHNALPLEGLIKKGHRFLAHLPAPQITWPARDAVDGQVLSVRLPVEEYFPGHLLYQLMLIMAEVREHVAEVRCERALLVHSRADLAAAPQSADHIYDRLPCRDKTLHWLRFAYHEFLLSRYRHIVFKHVHHFLKKDKNQ